ncbi:uncharacterized protein LOC112885293 [Panicum hallii]|uniref:uncharacterized protein LOC112885293 n=1 Tax=Panicum hallii TaxID=206008 RepID=UPI000DF4E01A|nr:uncharacterized protein LOC112885293 [Panicum hallii]
MGDETTDADAAALKARLDSLIKDAQEAEERAVAARRRATTARALLEEEERKAVALETAATTARLLVPGTSSGTVVTSSSSSSSSSYEATVVAGLHLQAASVLNVRSLVNIVLDSTSVNYASWRDLMMLALERYALLDHIDSDVASSTDPGWRRMDSIVLNWISNSITPELHQVVRERGATARHLWLAIENQFLGNHEQRTLHLDAAFRNFVQGDLSVSEYCRKFKNMADALADLGSPVDEQILILNILRGLNRRFEHVGAIIRRYSPFPSFLKARDDLILEELHMGSVGPSADATALYSGSADKLPSSAPGPPSRSGGTGRKGKNKKAAGGGGGRGGPSGHSTSTPPAPSGPDGKAPSSGPTYVNPWQGHFAMYPGPLPGNLQRPQVLMAAPDYYMPPGYMPGPQQQAAHPSLALAGGSAGGPAGGPVSWSPWTGPGWDQQSLANSFSTMALTPPSTSTQDWVADSGASHHSTPSAGNIFHTRPLTSSSPSSIIVGNGSTLPVASDLTTKNVIVRSNSTGPLYTMRLPSSFQTPPATSQGASGSSSAALEQQALRIGQGSAPSAPSVAGTSETPAVPDSQNVVSGVAEVPDSSPV